MKIRASRRDDLPGLIELFAEHAAYEGVACRCGDRLETLADMMFGESPRIFAWLAEDGDGRPAGYMTVTIDHSTLNAAPFAYLDCLYLRPQARGYGLGRRFMRLLQSFARAHGCEEIQWQTPTHNELGIGFYRRIGASESRKVRFFLESGAPI